MSNTRSFKRSNSYFLKHLNQCYQIQHDKYPIYNAGADNLTILTQYGHFTRKASMSGTHKINHSMVYTDSNNIEHILYESNNDRGQADFIEPTLSNHDIELYDFCIGILNPSSEKKDDKNTRENTRYYKKYYYLSICDIEVSERMSSNNCNKIRELIALKEMISQNTVLNLTENSITTQEDRLYHMLNVICDGVLRLYYEQLPIQKLMDNMLNSYNKFLYYNDQQISHETIFMICNDILKNYLNNFQYQQPDQLTANIHQKITNILQLDDFLIRFAVFSKFKDNGYNYSKMLISEIKGHHYPEFTIPIMYRFHIINAMFCITSNASDSQFEQYVRLANLDFKFYCYNVTKIFHSSGSRFGKKKNTFYHWIQYAIAKMFDSNCFIDNVADQDLIDEICKELLFSDYLYCVAQECKAKFAKDKDGTYIENGNQLLEHIEKNVTIKSNRLEANQSKKEYIKKNILKLKNERKINTTIPQTLYEIVEYYIINRNKFMKPSNNVLCSQGLIELDQFINKKLHKIEY